ncbi:MAG: hypothetical protein M1503_05615 [Thaumarchaeota archaeon]|nr:hypothetical protein [Nitrososphaerota archaeon]
MTKIIFRHELSMKARVAGLMGMVRLKIWPDGLASLDGKEFDRKLFRIGFVSNSELNEITNLSRKADFYNLKSVYSRRSDAFDVCDYKLTIQNSTTTKWVRWSSVSAEPIPEEFHDLAGYVSQIKENLYNSPLGYGG